MRIPDEIADLLPNFPEFAEISLKNQPAVDWFLKKYPPDISEYTFTNLFIWRMTRMIKFSLLEESLCVLAQDNHGNIYLMPPVGHGDACKLAKTLFSFIESSGHEPKMSRIPEDMANNLKDCGFLVELDRDNSDYVYLVSDLANLEGRKFDGKRNRIKKCLAEHNPEYKTMTPDIVEQCLELQTEWCNLRQCEANPGLASENVAVKEIFTYIDKLPVFGGAIFINGKIEAFSIGEKLDEQTAVVHFEKANPEIDGLYQLINQWFCQNELKDYIYVNREQDLGIEGLRRAKQSYHPHRMVEKYRSVPQK